MSIAAFPWPWRLRRWRRDLAAAAAAQDLAAAQGLAAAAAAQGLATAAAAQDLAAAAAAQGLSPAVTASICVVEVAGKATWRRRARRHPRSGMGAQVETCRCLVAVFAGELSVGRCVVRMYRCLVCCLLYMCLTMGRGWTHGGRCLYEPPLASNQVLPSPSL